MKKIICTLALLSLPLLQGCTVYYGGGGGYYGGGYYGGHYGWHHGGGWGGHGGWRDMLASATVSLDKNADDSAAHLAQDYSISATAAQKILDFASADDKAVAAKTLGVTAGELVSLVQLQMPNRAVVKKIAAHLGESSAKINAVMEDFIADMQAEVNAQQDRSGANP